MTDKPEPTLESLNEAARAIHYEDWDDAKTRPWLGMIQSIRAHARTLDKLHNRQPVDPDLKTAQEIVASYAPSLRKVILSGEWNDHIYMQIALAAIKHVRKEQNDG